MRYNKGQKSPAKFHDGIPKHNEQITSHGFVLHPTKGWRRIRTGNNAAGRAKTDKFISSYQPNKHDR